MKNGQTGPRTAEGKAIAAQNARRHGILSECPVILGVEQAEDWEAHRAAVYESFQPVGFLEASFVERVALSFWRLHRITRHEREVVAQSLRACEECTEDGKTHAEWLEMREHFQACARFFAELPRLKEGAPLDPEVVGAILTTLCWRKTAEELQRLRILEDRVSLAGVKQFAGWTAGLYRRALSELSGLLGTPVAILREAAEEYAQMGLQHSQDALALLETQRRQAQSHAHIPAPAEQARICRYEAHLSRELYKALGALEALQSRRTRAQVPARQPEAAPQPPATRAAPITPAPAGARCKTEDARWKAPLPTDPPNTETPTATPQVQDPGPVAACSVPTQYGGRPLGPRNTPRGDDPRPVSSRSASQVNEAEPGKSPMRNALQRVHSLLSPAAPD